jgi:hypothetical protein
VFVGSRSGWRIAMPLAAALQNSHQDGGRVFLNFVADPRTARLCNSDRFGSTGRRLGDRVRGEAVGAEGRVPAGLAVDGLVLHRRTISLPLCLRSLEEIPLLAGGTRRGHELANPRRTQRTAVEKSCPRHVSLTSVESK